MFKSSTSEKYSKIIDAELNLKIAKIQEIFDEIVKDVPIPESGDIVAFIGPTKAGKSTLINCLMGNPLIWRKDPYTEDICIDKQDSAPGPVIGGNGESETVIPKGYSTLPGTTFPMWDFPGFGDNKGTEQEIANAAAYERVLKIQESIRFVLVVPIDYIKNSNPLPFFKLLCEISLICRNVSNSLCIVATKSEKGTVSAWLEKAFSTRFDKANSENTKIINKGKSVIQCVLKNNHCIDFKAPITDGYALEGEFFLPNIKHIACLIEDLEGSTIGRNPLVISDQAKSEIQQLYIWYTNKLASEINDVCRGFDKFIQIKIDKDGDGKTRISTARLSFFQKNMEVIQELLTNTSDCKGFISGVEKLGFYLPTLAENIDKFIFIEKIQNMYKLENQEVMNGEKEFLKTIMITLKSVRNKYWDLIKNTEISIAEEQRLARAHNEQRARDAAEKEKYLKKVNEERERERAENEERRKRLNEERAREIAENEKRKKMMDEDREREKAQNARRMLEIDQERERERALDKERRKKRDKEIAEYEKSKKTMDQEREKERSEYMKGIMQMKEQMKIANRENEERLKAIEQMARETAERERRMNKLQNQTRADNEQKARHYAEQIYERERRAREETMFERQMWEKAQKMRERGVDLYNRERQLHDQTARQEQENQRRMREDEQKEKKLSEIENHTRQLNEKAAKELADIERRNRRALQEAKKVAAIQKRPVESFNEKEAKLNAAIENLKIENEQRAREIKEVDKKTEIARKIAETAKPKIVNTRINNTQNVMVVGNSPNTVVGGGYASIIGERPRAVTSPCTSATVDYLPEAPFEIEQLEDEESLELVKTTKQK